MKKCIIFGIVFLLLMPFVVNAESVRTGKFSYMPSFEEETEETYYYSDDYFKGSGKVYNEHLLSMSYNLALSTFEENRSDNCMELLKDIGFNDIKVYDMNQKATLDSLGMLIGHKEANGRDLISVAIRGSKYGSEWGNNFIVGEEGDAKGFSDSSAKAAARIKEYIDAYDLENVKIWIVGYSRAGAIADLLGVYMNRHLNEFHTAADDLYVYTFETPAASADDTVYDNIYIVKNKNDIIPNVYPEGWGFHTNGKIIEIGNDASITTYVGLSEQEAHGETKLSEFYRDLLGWISSRISRTTYAENLEGPISSLFDMYFSRSEADRELFLKFFTEDVKGALIDNEANKNALFGKAWALMSHNSDYLYEDLSKFIKSVLDSVRDSANGSTITDEEYEKIQSFIYPILRVAGPLLVDDDIYYEGIDYDYYYKKIAEDYLLTDEEMGKKYGSSAGYDVGYDAALYGYDYDDTPDLETSEFGPYYVEAYRAYYGSGYAEGFILGQEHAADPVAKGQYDAANYAYSDGYDAGNHREEYDPEPYGFYQHEWMSDEYYAIYEDAFAQEYERLYDLGYKEGSSVPEEEGTEYPDILELYHLATLIKNVKGIMAMHYPQNNLKLIQELDSYYAPYDLMEGAGQIIDIGDDKADELTVKTGGHLEKLVRVQVDGQALDACHCDLRSGSTILTLKDSYLKTLSVGTHTLKLIYIDNVIETEFTITKTISHVPIPITGID